MSPRSARVVCPLLRSRWRIRPWCSRCSGTVSPFWCAVADPVEGWPKIKPMVDAKLRAWWSHKQGLDGSLAGQSPAEVLDRTGWARSVAGAGPYLTFFSRAGLRRADVDAAIA